MQKRNHPDRSISQLATCPYDRIYGYKWVVMNTKLWRMLLQVCGAKGQSGSEMYVVRIIALDNYLPCCPVSDSFNIATRQIKVTLSLAGCVVTNHNYLS